MLSDRQNCIFCLPDVALAKLGHFFNFCQFYCMPIIKNIEASQIRELSVFRVGNTVKVHQKIREGSKERVQIFEGLVIAKKGGTGVNGTFMVRKISYGVGVERVFPLAMPAIEKIEIIKTSKVRRAKLYYLRAKSAKETRRKLRAQTVDKSATAETSEATESHTPSETQE